MCAAFGFGGLGYEKRVSFRFCDTLHLKIYHAAYALSRYTFRNLGLRYLQVTLAFHKSLPD
jgi:hypothetical protein